MYHYYVLVLYVYAKAHILRDKEGLHVLKDIRKLCDWQIWCGG